MKQLAKFFLMLSLAFVPAIVIAVTGAIWGQRFSFWWNYKRGVPDGYHVVAEPDGCQWLWSHREMGTPPIRREGHTRPDCKMPTWRMKAQDTRSPEELAGAACQAKGYRYSRIVRLGQPELGWQEVFAECSNDLQKWNRQ